jgi:uncharacterized membrane protein
MAQLHGPCARPLEFVEQGRISQSREIIRFMPTDEKYEELQRLIAALTERVYKLEQVAGMRPGRAPRSEEAERQVKETRGIRGARKGGSDAETELESKIGGHWLNRIGIVAVLIGVSYFLKYAFDNAWIGPAGRVVIGLVAGMAVVFWSEHVRRSGYAIFSYSLKAIGIGVLYLSLWASSQLYNLIPNALAFFSMAAITAATVGLALWQDAEIIAAFAALGAFITPVALSTGANNAFGLFSYLFILDVGALILIRYRPWPQVLIGSFAGTLVLYSSWHSTFYTPEQFSTALIAISVVFAAFALVPFASGQVPTSAAIPILALLNAATYFFEVWELFEHKAESYQAAIAAVALGCLYFLIAYKLRGRVTLATADIHWAIGAAFLVAAVPIGMHSPWITITWFVEGAALTRVGQLRETDYLKHLGGTALVLGTVRLLAVDHFDVTQLLLNERMMTFAVAIAATADAAYHLNRRDRHEQSECKPAGAYPAIKERNMLAILVVMINVFALVVLTQEITDAWRRQLQGAGPGADRTLATARDFAYSALWMSYGAGLMLVGFWKKSRFIRWQALILIGATVCKVFLYDMSSLDRGYRILSFIALGLILLATSFLYQRSSKGPA